MSVTSARNALQQIERQIERMEKRRSDAVREAAKLDKKIAEKEKEIQKSNSPSAVRSKRSQLDKLTADRNKANNDAAEASKKLAALVTKKHKAEAELRREQQKELDRETEQMQRTIGGLTEKLEDHTAFREPNMIMQCVRPLVERYPDALSLFDSAAKKYEEGGLDRNALDDMRLCFELILKNIFANDKSLENQLETIGRMMKAANLSPEFRNMFHTLVDYYCKYQNNHVKHGESINPYEVAYIIEFTCVLLKQIIEQYAQEPDDVETEH